MTVHVISSANTDLSFQVVYPISYVFSRTQDDRFESSCVYHLKLILTFHLGLMLEKPFNVKCPLRIRILIVPALLPDNTKRGAKRWKNYSQEKRLQAFFTSALKRWTRLGKAGCSHISSTQRTAAYSLQNRCFRSTWRDQYIGQGQSRQDIPIAILGIGRGINADTGRLLGRLALIFLENTRETGPDHKKCLTSLLGRAILSLCQVNFAQGGES